MLESLNKVSKKWWFRVLLGSMALLFLLSWGLGDFFRGSSLGQQHVATVGSLEINQAQLDEEYQRYYQNIQRKAGKPITLPKSVQTDLYRAALSTLVTKAVWQQKFQDMGLEVTKAYVREQIQNLPIFQRDGTFDVALFHERLKQLGMDEKTFVDQMKYTLLLERFQGALFSKTPLVPIAQRALSMSLGQTRHVKALVLDEKAFKPKHKPSDKDLEAFYHEKKNIFAAPVAYDVDVIVVTPYALEKKITPQDEKLSQEIKSLGLNKMTPENNAQIKALKQNMAANAVFDEVSYVEEAIMSGENIKEIAKKKGYMSFSIASLTHEGLQDLWKKDLPKVSVSWDDAQERKAVLSRENARKIASAASQLEKNMTSPAIDLGQRMYAFVMLKEKHDAHDRHWRDVNPKMLISFFEGTLAEKAMLEKAKEISEKVHTLKDLEKQAKALKQTLVPYSVNLEGAQKGPVTLPRQGIEKVFETPVKKAFYHKAGMDDKMMVGFLTNIDYGDQNSASNVLGYSDSLMEAYLSHLQNQYRVQFNARFLKSLGT